MPDLFDLINQTWGADRPSETDDTTYEDLVNSIKGYDSADKRKEDIRNRVNRIEAALLQDPDAYRRQKMAERFGKEVKDPVTGEKISGMSKKARFGTGVLELLSGLGGKPGQIRQYEDQVNKDYNTRRQGMHELLMLNRAEQGQVNKDADIEMAAKKQQFNQLMADKNFNLAKEKLKAINDFKTKQQQLENKKFGLAVDNAEWKKLTDIAKIEAMQKGKPPKNEVELLNYMLENKMIDEKTFIQKSNELIKAKMTKSGGKGSQGQEGWTTDQFGVKRPFKKGPLGSVLSPQDTIGGDDGNMFSPGGKIN